MEKYITSWFNTPRSKELSPNQSIGLISREFIHCIRNYGYDIENMKVFQRRLCTALCVLYDKKLSGSRFHLSILPIDSFDTPMEWTQEKESIWFDYHRCVVFDTNFWIDFWEMIPSMEWEKEVDNWRMELQDIMIQSIDRDENILSNKCGFKPIEIVTIPVDNESYMSD